MLFKSKYKVVRPFNHNVVLCLHNNKECIVIGKGVGFAVKPGDSIKNIDNIEKEFYLVDSNNKENFKNLTDSIDDSIIGATEEAIAIISQKFKKELNEKIHITLADHIAFAVKRLENGIQINNVLLHEIRFLYKEEFEAAEEMLAIINKRLDKDLPKDEIGFIAMHLHAAINNQDISKSSMDNAIIADMIGFIEEKAGRELDKYSIDYCRMVTHLRFAIDRVRNNMNINNILINSIKENYSSTYEIAKELASIIKRDYGIEFPEGEIGYITIHLQNILKN